MKTLGKLALVASVIACLGAATVAQAHGIWFAQRSNQLALIYGAGAEDLDAVKRLPKVKSVAAYDENGKEVPTQLAPNGPNAATAQEMLKSFDAKLETQYKNPTAPQKKKK